MIRTLPVLPPKSTTDQPLTQNQVAKHLTGRDYISYSSISTYQRCPLRYYFAYVEGLAPEFKSSTLIFGGAIHSAIELHFRNAFEGMAPPSINELPAEYDQAWKTDATTAVRFGKNETVESLRDLAARMLLAFQDSEVVNMDGTPLSVEEQFREAIIPGCPDLLGRIDLLMLTKKRVRIIDFKTSRSSWSPAKVQEAAPQQLLYAELVKPLAKALGGRTPEVEWVVLTKTKQPKVERHTLTPTASQIERTKATVYHVWQSIKAGHFYPTLQSKNCSMCSHRKACDKWGTKYDPF